jgi:hypothetical protein
VNVNEEMVVGRREGGKEGRRGEEKKKQVQLLGDSASHWKTGKLENCPGFNRLLGVFVRFCLSCPPYHAVAFQVYCDLTNEQGGWMLVLSYAKAASVNPALVVGTFPLDPVSSFSHISTATMGKIPFTEMRWYCTTSRHARKIHFRTSNTNLVNFMKGVAGASNSASYWNTGFTAAAGHTGVLPTDTNSAAGGTGSAYATAEFSPFPLTGKLHPSRIFTLQTSK